MVVKAMWDQLTEDKQNQWKRSTLPGECFSNYVKETSGEDEFLNQSVHFTDGLLMCCLPLKAGMYDNTNEWTDAAPSRKHGRAARKDVDTGGTEDAAVKQPRKNKQKRN